VVISKPNGGITAITRPRGNLVMAVEILITYMSWMIASGAIFAEMFQGCFPFLFEKIWRGGRVLR